MHVFVAGGTGTIGVPLVRALAAAGHRVTALTRSTPPSPREYIGPWLPEPILTSPKQGPDVMLQQTESVTLAFLMLLETLSPEERAVFLLKKIYEYDHGEIAEMLNLTEASSRQVLHRAKARIKESRPRLSGTPESKRESAERFVAAFQSGNAQALAELLARDVGVWTDGGGKVSASRRPLVGRDEVLNFLVGLHRVAVRTGLYSQASVAIDEVNGEPAILLRVSGKLDGVFVITIGDGLVQALRVVRNPDKLAFIDRQLARARPM